MKCGTIAAISNLLLATDFSGESAQAVECARRISGFYGAKLHIVHVMDLFPFSLRNDDEASMRMEQIRSLAGTKMNSFIRDHQLHENNPETALLAGEPFAAIERFTTERDIDLIVLGSSGERGLNRLFNGSAAEEIFRTARCPVMVVGPKAAAQGGPGGFHRLVFATDMSETSRAALPMLEFVLSRDPSATVSLAHFLDQESGNVFARHAERERMQGELVAMIGANFRPQVAEVVAEFSSPEKGMLDLAEGFAADLLVLGVRSGGAFTRAETHGLRSIAPRVISEASCPVLTIRGD
jgi:nucleotide-binding universal stress UspA family protein